jgi:hypothetical protein
MPSSSTGIDTTRAGPEDDRSVVGRERVLHRELRARGREGGGEPED